MVLSLVIPQVIRFCSRSYESSMNPQWIKEDLKSVRTILAMTSVQCDICNLDKQYLCCTTPWAVIFVEQCFIYVISTTCVLQLTFVC
jgi:hypothetical protein